MYGFVYLISCTCCGFENYKYIGQKQFFSTRTKRLSKKGQLENWSGKGRKPTKIKAIASSGWEKYNSSSKELQELIKKLGESCFTYEIIAMAPSKSWLSYLESYEIFVRRALIEEEYLNKWVSCRIRAENLK